MRVNKPTFAYKLVQLSSNSIKTRTKKTINNLTRINWNTQLINKHFMTLYWNNCKKIRLDTLLKWTKKASYLFFNIAHNVLLTPLPFIFIFLLYNFIIFLRQYSFIPSPTISIFSPSQYFLFPPPTFYYFPSLLEVSSSDETVINQGHYLSSCCRRRK